MIIKPKNIIDIPTELKDNNTLLSIYFVLKGKYLSYIDRYNIITGNSHLYKAFGNSAEFLLNDKKDEIKSKISELEKFLNNYGDLQDYLNKQFEPPKSCINTLVFIKKEELSNIIKKGNIPSEINNIFKLIYYIIDEAFEDYMEGEELINHFMQEIMNKYNANDAKTVISSYLAEHKNLNITREKFDKIINLIKSNDKILSTVDIVQINRNIGYCIPFLRECYNYINMKSLDDVPVFELREKNKMLEEYKKKLEQLEKKKNKTTVEF